MILANFKILISCLAAITTVLQFLSGVVVCMQYVKNKTTAEASPLPLLCGVLSCSLWMLYGLVKLDNLIVIVNLIGLVLMVAYTIVFFIYASKKTNVAKLILIAFGYMMFMLHYIKKEGYIRVLLYRLGYTACTFTIVTVVAPMSKLLHVYRVKNTECLPFPMILMSFVVCTFWSLYGLMEYDNYVMRTNSAGAVLALCQLSLFVIYPDKSTSPSSKSITA